MNLVQALETLTQNWCGATDAQRALSLAWITHLTADVHQPLHATALYAFPAFIRADRGDRGGNDILVVGASPLRADNLHALWDGALGDEWKYRQLEALAREYGRTASDDEERRQRRPAAPFPVVGETEPCIGCERCVHAGIARGYRGRRRFPSTERVDRRCVSLGDARHGGSSDRARRTSHRVGARSARRRRRIGGLCPTS